MYNGLDNGLIEGSYLTHTNGGLNNDENLDYIAEAKNYFKGAKIGEGSRVLLNNFIKGCKLDGNLDQIDIMYMFAVPDKALALRNIINPDLYTITEVSNPTFTPNQGIAGNGSSSYLKTGWNPATNALKLSLNSVSMGIYSRTDDSALTTVRDDFGSTDTTQGLNLRLRDTTGLRRARTNGATLSNNAYVGTTQGLFYAFRTSSTSQKTGHNTTDEFTNANNSSSIASKEIYICCINNNGSASNFTTRQYSFMWIGSNSVNITLLYNRLNEYLTAIGANV